MAAALSTGDLAAGESRSHEYLFEAKRRLLIWLLDLLGGLPLVTG